MANETLDESEDPSSEFASGGDPARPPAQYLSNIEHTQAGPSLRFRNQVEK
jgi:hypothetical protein